MSQADDERGHIGHFPDASQNPPNADGIRSADTWDTSDTSPKVISQKTMAAWDEVMAQVVGEAVKALNPESSPLSGDEVDPWEVKYEGDRGCQKTFKAWLLF